MEKPMRGLFAALFIAGAAITGSASAEDAAGDWVGQLNSGFKVRIHVDKATDGYKAFLTNPSGNQTDLEQVRCDGQHLHFEVAKLDLRYDGDWDEAQHSWRGTLILQGTYQLDLRRATAAEMAPAEHKRPQEDAIKAGPRPYTDQEVAFDNPAGHDRLAGTLTLPSGAKGPVPVVVLISGTGHNTRDEDVWGHKVFLVLADAFARRGIATLRYDKRGVGGSTGNYDTATTADFASDAIAGVSYLKGRSEIDPRRIGVLGHSEGGIIAPMVAVEDQDVSFVIMVAGPGIRGDHLFVDQSMRTSRVYGAPEDYIKRRAIFDQSLYDAIISAPSDAEALARAKVLVAKGVTDKLVDAAEAESLATDATSPWERYFLAYDPAPTLRRLKVPILAVNGSLDVQVPAAENLPAIRAALVANPDATVTELPGLNHILQNAKTGGPNEYNDIDETVSPSALKLLTDWAVAHTQ
jgi:pimeloyl-ACP methyl ester carboxylesterase